ncbi:hypothetical protein EJB05_25825, partial [Eragrostis curvula]
MKYPAVAMPQALWIQLLSLALVVVVSHLVVAAASESLPPISKPGCPDRCGNVSIPYPFGIGDACAMPSLGNGFNITCNQSFNPPRPYSSVNQQEIINITVETGEMRVVSPVSYVCYNDIDTISDRANLSLHLDSPFLMSKRRNKFTAVGCRALAFVGRDKQDLSSGSYITGCFSVCESLEDMDPDGEDCAGRGCCQMGLPTNLSTASVIWSDDSDPSNDAWNFSPCNYAFVADKDWYHFRQDDLSGNKSFISRNGKTAPLVLDWAIKSNGSCTRPEATGAQARSMTPACVSENSHCVNATQGEGYLCNCSTGYQGNPYVKDGCIDINECDLRKSNPTIYEEKYYCGKHSKCHNIPGGYECKCTGLFPHGNGTSVEGCQPIVPGYILALVATLVAILLLAVLLWFVLTEHKRRQRKGFFDKNGGKLLKGAGIHIYTEDEMKMITKQYSEPIGGGNFGKVFKGIIEADQRVAVKRAIVDDSSKIREGGEFVDEITFQFQMKHPNMVRLIGCCLETDVPMLVFEFIPNGSLADVLHGDASTRRQLSLLQRLDIAIGSAEALRYMHYSHVGGHHKMIHGDVKSANILLDDDLKPKVSDFGSSKVMSTASRYVRFVASDMNYVDPVYYKTGRFTEKSDVYSFGVVLLEIITRKPAKYDGSNSLPIDFIKTCKVGGNGRKMYDEEILTHDAANSNVYMEFLDRIADLAMRCLKEDDDERPTMEEVLEELMRVKLRASG